MPTVDDALALAARGYAIFPCRGKKPAIRGGGGFKGASKDEATIRAWWADHPSANIGVATGAVSGFWALDIDTKNAGDETLAQWEKEHGILPKTVAVITGTGGMHYYFKYTKPISCNAGKLGPGIDIRADGGYVIAPPSVHPDTGRAYAWELSALPEETPLVEAPIWLDAKLEAARSKDQLEIVGIPSGQKLTHNRNVTLTAIGGRLRRLGASQETLAAALHGYNRDLFEVPLQEAEVMAIAKSLARYAAEGIPPEVRETDMGNAKRLVMRHGGLIRYVPNIGWHLWDGARWAVDKEDAVIELAKDVANWMFADAETVKDANHRKAAMRWAITTQASARIKAMVDLAKSDPALVARADDFDADPMLFNCPNGTLDLRTGKLKPHRKEDLISKVGRVNYNPDADMTVWLSFINKIFMCEKGLDYKLDAQYVKTLAGYFLSGDIRDEALYIANGDGQNGKTTLFEGLAHVMGDYAQTAAVETFLSRKEDKIPADLAMLKGARLVLASEPEAQRRLAVALVKSVTGGDQILARFFHKDFFPYRPQFKVVLATNHLPVIKDTDHAIWRRIRDIVFGYRIPDNEKDGHYKRWIRETHGEAILLWAVQGAADWVDSGYALIQPKHVQQATAAYREGQDLLGTFFLERCTVAPDVQAGAKALYQAYCAWCQDSGEHPKAQRTFGMSLRERGFKQGHARWGDLWEGIGLKEETAPSLPETERGEMEAD